MHISFTHPPRPPVLLTKRRSERQCEPKKQNKMDGNESHQVLAAEDIIVIIQQRPALLDTGGVESYQMTNSGKQQRCFFFLSANKNKKQKKHRATQRRKQERANRPGRHARRVPPMIPRLVWSISDARHAVSRGHFKEAANRATDKEEWEE